MKFSIKDFFSECDQICSYLRIWSHLLKKSLTKNFIFGAVPPTEIVSMVFNMAVLPPKSGIKSDS